MGISVQRGDYFFLAHYACPAFTDMALSHLQQCLRVAAHLVGSPVSRARKGWAGSASTVNCPSAFANDENENARYPR